MWWIILVLGSVALINVVFAVVSIKTKAKAVSENKELLDLWLVGENEKENVCGKKKN